MRLKSRNLILLLIAFLFFGTAEIYPQKTLSEKDTEAIRQIEESFSEAWLKNDEQGVLSLFWDDAMLYPNGRDAVRGTAGIKKVWFTPSERITILSQYDTTLEEIYGRKNLAFAVGSNEIVWTSKNKDESDSRRFAATRHFMAIYEKRDKKWKILRRHWSGKLREIK